MFPSTNVTLWARGRSPKQNVSLEYLLLSHPWHDQNHTDRWLIEKLHSVLLRYLLSCRPKTRRSWASSLTHVKRKWRNTECLFRARQCARLCAKSRAWGCFLTAAGFENHWSRTKKTNWFDSMPTTLCEEIQGELLQDDFQRVLGPFYYVTFSFQLSWFSMILLLNKEVIHLGPTEHLWWLGIIPTN